MCSSGTAVSSRCVQQSRQTVVSGSRVRQSCPANVSDDGRARQIPGPFHPTPLLYPKQCHSSSDRFVQFISNPSAEHDGHSANLLAWGEIILELAGCNGRTQACPAVVSGSRVRQSCLANVSNDGQIPGLFHPTPLLYSKQCHLNSACPTVVSGSRVRQSCPAVVSDSRVQCPASHM
jgi:hypothetical protein